MSPEPGLADQSVTTLKGVGPGLRDRLSRLGIHSVQDLLFHLPLRYQDRTRITPIGQVRQGQDVMVEGELVSAGVDLGRRRSLFCRLRDDSGMIGLRFYYFSSAQRQRLQPGARLRCHGEIRPGKSGYEIYHPEYQDASAGQPVEDRLTPIYPATEGLQQTRLRALMKQALERLSRQGDTLQEWLPEALCPPGLNFSLTRALQYVHQPPVDARIELLEQGRHPSQQRLAFEELLAHRLSMRRIRQQARQFSAAALPGRNRLTRQLLDHLPFPLTAAQQRVLHDISRDLADPVPGLRLLQGDVGSGKTVVAALAALQVVENDHQAVIMAPTELLAEQHFISFSEWLTPLGLQVGWLSGRVKGRRRDQQLSLIADGTAQVVVGTHALFQDDVQFHRLGLVIIDEQHRFGVHQRLALREKGAVADTRRLPHQLVMTATPIPRTLAMSAYADLEVSVIDELPPGRTPVNTVVISSERREQVIERIRDTCRRGSQVYWVCTLIEESEAVQCQAAEATAEQLSEQLPELRIGLVHGRMKPADKTRVMEAFKSGGFQLLVATTVIEVGVDVPNASVMIIENPERLGLAQLHQLRGRVGRGRQASHCILLYQTPLSEAGRERLMIMRDSNDGFHIAEEDLRLRGPGQVLGTRQTGLMDFRVADLERDGELLALTLTPADRLLHEYPGHVDPLIRRWLGDRELYGNV
ncbi:MAG: ATP-dependent DNA helicase RecG [Pseudomonadota bacterium]